LRRGVAPDFSGCCARLGDIISNLFFAYKETVYCLTSLLRYGEFAVIIRLDYGWCASRPLQKYVFRFIIVIFQDNRNIRIKGWDGEKAFFIKPVFINGRLIPG
jgi:hypothetical protein